MCPFTHKFIFEYVNDRTCRERERECVYAKFSRNLRTLNVQKNIVTLYLADIDEIKGIQQHNNDVNL